MGFRDVIYYKNNANRPSGARRCMGAIAGGTFGLVIGGLIFSLLGQPFWLIAISIIGLIAGYRLGPVLISNK